MYFLFTTDVQNFGNRIKSFKNWHYHRSKSIVKGNLEEYTFPNIYLPTPLTR